MQKNMARIICFCSLMISLAVLFQSAPVFLPVAGLAVSPLSSLPVALAAVRSKLYGFLSWAAGALMLLIIFPQESAIFVFSTGLIGLLLGLFYTKRAYASVIITSFALFAGILALQFVFQINVFGDFAVQFPLLVSIPAFLAFSVAYVSIWSWIVRFSVRFLVKIRQLEQSPGSGKTGE